ncbi:uncharacterized protein LOC142294950 [Anomaloglossus baeobatrachus]
MCTNKEEFLREFIEVYQTQTPLWKIKSPEYSNRQLKKDAYLKMIAIYDKYHPNQKGTEDLVKRKIQAIRTVYKKELNKIEESKRSGAGTGDVYVPTLWYFDLLNFTRDQELHRPSTSSLNIGGDIPPDANNEVTISEEPTTSQQSTSEQLMETPASQLTNVDLVEAGPSNVSYTQSWQRRKKTIPPNTTTAVTKLMGVAQNILDQHNRPPLSGIAMFVDD